MIFNSKVWGTELTESSKTKHGADSLIFPPLTLFAKALSLYHALTYSLSLSLSIVHSLPFSESHFYTVSLSSFCSSLRQNLMLSIFKQHFLALFLSSCHGRPSGLLRFTVPFAASPRTSVTRESLKLRPQTHTEPLRAFPLRLFSPLSFPLSLSHSLARSTTPHLQSQKQFKESLAEPRMKVSFENVVGFDQCDQKKSPNAYKSCPKMISLEKW